MKLLFPESHLPGSYYHRLAHDRWSLELYEDHRFSASHGACLGESTYEGTWLLDGDVLILTPDPLGSLDEHLGMTTRYILVWWGNRHLLVTELQMAAFCANARGKAPPQEAMVEGVHLVKVLAPGAPAGGGVPVIPERYRHFYERGPIRARVASLRDDGTVNLETESNDRIEVGMRLTTGRYSRIHSELQITSVSEHAVVGLPYYSQWSEQRVAEGVEFTTGQGWRYPVLMDRERRAAPAPPRPRIAIRHKDTHEILDRICASPEGQALHINGDLQGADLREAGPGSDAPLNLIGAWGWFAHLQRAILEGQDLREASFRGGQLEGVNARDAKLVEADLSDANLRSIVLAGADLTNANLQNADLSGADLLGAQLRRALLCATDLRGADLTGADLRGADLTFARFDRDTRWPAGFDPATARRGPGRSTRLRSYVSFRADRNRIPFGCQGTRESIRSLLARALHELDVPIDPYSFDCRCGVPARINGRVRNVLHDSTNRFRCSHRGFSFHVLVGAPGGWFFKEDREWLVTVHLLPGIAVYLTGGRAEAACHTVCSRLNQILKLDSRFTRIRWYTEAAWNTGTETGWSEAP